MPREPADAAREASEALVLFGGAPSGLPVELRIGKGTRRSGFLRARGEVAFEVRIPIASLEFEERKGAHEADVELTFVSVDLKGDVSPPMTMKAPLRVPDGDWEKARQATWPYDGKFIARPDTRRFTVTVRDVRSNRVGTAEANAPAAVAGR